MSNTASLKSNNAESNKPVSNIDPEAAQFDKKAYQREYMRKKREAAKGVASGTDDEPAA